MRETRVLVVVKTRTLMRVIDHLLHNEPNLRVVARSSNGGRLTEYAACLRPALIVTHARLLGRKAASAVAEVKRSSPASKLIMICSFQRSPNRLRKSGADACLLEEALVRQFLLVVRKLLCSGDRAFPKLQKALQSRGGTSTRIRRKEQ